MGGTGLEPVTPSLSIRGSRSRQFARMRPGSMVERNPLGDRTLERTRTNANPCHSCHTRQRIPGTVVLLLVIVHGGRECGAATSLASLTTRRTCESVQA